jgi:hypothetical protein
MGFAAQAVGTQQLWQFSDSQIRKKQRIPHTPPKVGVDGIFYEWYHNGCNMRSTTQQYLTRKNY